jgi:hypothetical protein
LEVSPLAEGFLQRGVLMGMTETRHTEKANLFQVLKARHENDFDSAVASIQASMEPDDVADVLRLFEEWKKNRAELKRP